MRLRALVTVSPDAHLVAIGPRESNEATLMTLETKKTKAVKQGKPVNIDSTELHTWFERDRAHVELRSKLDDNTIVEWWDESVGEAIEDGFLNPKDYHSSA